MSAGLPCASPRRTVPITWSSASTRSNSSSGLSPGMPTPPGDTSPPDALWRRGRRNDYGVAPAVAVGVVVAAGVADALAVGALGTVVNPVKLRKAGLVAA